MAWSPEQISHRLRNDFPDDEAMRISHEAIYQSLFIQGRGALKRELVACLRTGRALREPRARSRNKPQEHVTADVVLSERPAAPVRGPAAEYLRRSCAHILESVEACGPARRRGPRVRCRPCARIRRGGVRR